MVSKEKALELMAEYEYDNVDRAARYEHPSQQERCPKLDDDLICICQSSS